MAYIALAAVSTLLVIAGILFNLCVYFGVRTMAHRFNLFLEGTYFTKRDTSVLER
jgi:hypothetical protein